MDPTYRLCYVKDSWAWFTSLSLKQQWGSGWAKRPYEYNASPLGIPDGTDHRMVKVAFDGEFRQPCDGFDNSPYSVEQINAGAAAWLAPGIFADHNVVIPAGTTLADFVTLVEEAGGTVYFARIDSR